MGGIREEVVIPLRLFPNKGLASLFYNNEASGSSSFAMGQENSALGRWGIAMGFKNKTSLLVDAACAIGYECESNGFASWSSGLRCISSGNASISMGLQNNSKADYSAIIGGQNNSIAPTGIGCVVLGGNGLNINGTEQYKTYVQDLEVLNNSGGIFLYSPNGNRWKLTVTNAGTLQIVAAP